MRHSYQYLIERKDKTTGYYIKIWVDDIRGLKGWSVISKRIVG